MVHTSTYENITTKGTNGFAITALILGIISLLLSPLSILAIIFGGVGIGQTGPNSNYKGRGMAIAGLVLGIVAIVLWVGILIWDFSSISGSSIVGTSLSV